VRDNGTWIEEVMQHLDLAPRPSRSRGCGFIAKVKKKKKKKKKK